MVFEVPSLQTVQAMNLSKLVPLTNNCEINMEEFLGRAGQQHYKLLAYLSTLWDGVEIFDIGTHRGASSLALSYNSKNKVLSFDIEHKYRLAQVENIQYFLEDLFDESVRSGWEARLLASPFIFLDIDPHEGTRELKFYKWLEEKQYKGIVILDDIWYFKDMRDKFWYEIPTEHKIDITHLGHWSGTGLLQFGAGKPTDQSWTLVTAYFDLTKMPDASASIRGRPAEHYLQHANATLALDYPMVVFCEPENLEAVKSRRPAWLAEKTKYITMSFEDFPLTQYRQKIIENRVETSREIESELKYYFKPQFTDMMEYFKSISKIKAERQAIQSAQLSLDSSQASYKAGTRTIVDVLLAQENL